MEKPTAIRDVVLVLHDSLRPEGIEQWLLAANRLGWTTADGPHRWKATPRVSDRRRRPSWMAPTSSTSCFKLAPEGTVTVTRTENGLVAHATEPGCRADLAATETAFFVKVIPAPVTFQFDPHGAVIGLILRFGGKEMHGTKVR